MRTDKLIKTRMLSDAEVITINHVLKSRSKRYIASGNSDWLWPEKTFKGSWQDIRATLLPPKEEIWKFQGEMFIEYGDGSVSYQDAFGRKTQAADFLNKDVKESELGVNGSCGCGSGRKYKKCCKSKPDSKRTSWKVLSIRERNLLFFKALNGILGLDSGKDWNDVRRELDEDKVKRIHELYAYLWPSDTDLFELLPKPDGCTRALYAGILDPRTTPLVISNVCLYFGDVLVQNPFMNPNQVKKEFSPVENPSSYLFQTLKNLFFFFRLFPLIESGRVNMFPDPASVDPFLQRHALELAQLRSTSMGDPECYTTIQKGLMKEDFCLQTMCLLPKEVQERWVREASPNASNELVQYFLTNLEKMRLDNPLFPLHDTVFEGGQSSGQFTSLQMAPNFELMLMIAQAAGAFIVTDSHYRWAELRAACHKSSGVTNSLMPKLVESLSAKSLPVCENLMSAQVMLSEGKLRGHRKWIEELNRSLFAGNVSILEKSLSNAHDCFMTDVKRQFGDKAQPGFNVHFQYIMPEGGMYHNNVRRLMINSGIDDRPERIPLAILMDIKEK